MQEYQAKDKVVQKNSRDGLTEENLHTGEKKSVSAKTQEALIQKETEDTRNASNAEYDQKKRRQQVEEQTVEDIESPVESGDAASEGGAAAEGQAQSTTEEVSPEDAGISTLEAKKSPVDLLEKAEKDNPHDASSQTVQQTDPILQKQISAEAEYAAAESPIDSAVKRNLTSQELGEEGNADTAVKENHRPADQSARMQSVHTDPGASAMDSDSYLVRSHGNKQKNGRQARSPRSEKSEANVAEEREDFSGRRNTADRADSEGTGEHSGSSSKFHTDDRSPHADKLHETEFVEDVDLEEFHDETGDKRKREQDDGSQKKQGHTARKGSDAEGTNSPAEEHPHDNDSSNSSSKFHTEDASPHADKLHDTEFAEGTDLEDFREDAGDKRKREKANGEQKKQKASGSGGKKTDRQGSEKKKKKSRLSFDDEEQGMVRGAGMKVGKSAVAGSTAATSAALHSKIRQNEKDNSGIEAAHKSELAAEGTLREVKNHTSQNRTRQQSSSRRLKFDEAESAQSGGTTAKKKSTEQKKQQQKRWQKREYQKAYQSTARGAKSTTEAAKATESAATRVGNSVTTVISNNKSLLIGLAVAGILFLVMGAAFSSCGAMIGGVGSVFIGTTYPSTDEDIYATEDAYVSLESGLQSQINNMESTHPGYDEYNYQVDEIGHNPYYLISYFTAKYGEFTYEQVADEINDLFSQQYTLTVESVTEIRTRTETRTGTRTVTDPETGKEIEVEYEYEVEVEYEYYILNVTLTNHGFDAVARSNLTSDEADLYSAYNLTFGNRSYLFDTETVYAGSGGLTYVIPSEALSDEKFANMIREAEKYLGMAYVWGGSSPSTGFDCSGFVCWVINNCGNGWSVGRLTADGLLGVCDIIPASEAQPGDLIFFQGTYNTSGASHVGIYVGDGMMIHCGNPIQYTSINTSYWQQHFYCYGRIR